MSETAIVKTQTTRYEITAVMLDFLTFGETFRHSREGRRYRASACFRCRRSFEDGEKISLAFCRTGNKAVCRACGEALQKELGQAGGE